MSRNRPLRRCGTALLTASFLLTGCGAGRPAAAVSSPRPHRVTPAQESAAATSSPSPDIAATPSSNPQATRRAHSEIAHLTAYLGHGGVSIAALDTVTGRTFGYGASHGMLCASIAKLFILETLLLRHQHSGRPLHPSTVRQATRMIENSDNDAANDIYTDMGEGRALRRSAGPLGLERTVPGPGIYWGFTHTSARDYLALLRDLVAPQPLTRSSRSFALRLLSHVEADQRWGVGSAADKGTRFYNKNGWLPASPDHGRWVVNTVGIVTVHGQRVLMAVLTQHGRSFDGGVRLVDRLSRITARAVTSG